MRVAARSLVVVVALVACAWFAIGARQAHETDAAAAIVGPGGPRTPAALHRAAGLIDDGAFLFPGQNVPLLRASLEIEQRRYPAARRTVERIVRAEPENLEGWIDLSALYLLAPRIARETGIAPAALRRHLVRLDPIDARRL